MAALTGIQIRQHACGEVVAVPLRRPVRPGADADPQKLEQEGVHRESTRLAGVLVAL